MTDGLHTGGPIGYAHLNIFSPESELISSFQRFNLQRTRLREQLDKTEDFGQKITLERLILEIDSKTVQPF